MYAACVHMGLGVEAKAILHSSPEDYAMGQKEWDLDKLKDMEMTVSETYPLYDDGVLVAREKREIGEETLWVIKTTFVAVGVIHARYMRRNRSLGMEIVCQLTFQRVRI